MRNKATPSIAQDTSQRRLEFRDSKQSVEQQSAGVEGKKTKQYLRQKDLVQITGMSDFYWERLRWAKEGPPFAKLGKAVLYPEAEFYAWLDSKLQSAGKDGEQIGSV